MLKKQTYNHFTIHTKRIQPRSRTIHCVQKKLGMREFENSPAGFAAVFTLTCQLAKLLQLKQDFALNKSHFSSELRLTK